MVLRECTLFDYTSARPCPPLYMQLGLIRLHQAKCMKAEAEPCRTEFLAKTHRDDVREVMVHCNIIQGYGGHAKASPKHCNNLMQLVARASVAVTVARWFL